MGRTLISHRFTELQPGEIYGTFVTPEGDPIPGDAIDSVALTLYDIEVGKPHTSPAGGVINGRNADDLTIGTEITINQDGEFVLYLTGDDHSVPDDEAAAEKVQHRQVWRHAVWLHVVYTIGSPAVEGTIDPEFEIWVDNLRKAG